MTDGPEAPAGSPVTRALRGRCPRCGKGKLFDSYLTLRPACPVCELDFAFVDSGDGPAVFVALIAGTIVVALALWTEVNYEPPFWVHIIIFVPLTLVVCLGILQPCKGLMIGLQYRNKAEQGRVEP